MVVMNVDLQLKANAQEMGIHRSNIIQLKLQFGYVVMYMTLELAYQVSYQRALHEFDIYQEFTHLVYIVQQKKQFRLYLKGTCK